ncbi:MAG: hypothetical protein ACTHLW_00980 [Verrucomicrobiota bacterium]
MAESQFEITKRSPRSNYSMLTTPATAWKRGQAFQEGATADSAVLADGTRPIIGFATRNGEVGGPDLAYSFWPNQLEGPINCGDEASFEDAEEFEAEGDDYLDASVDGTIAIGDKLSFADGKLIEAAAGKIAEYMVVGKPAVKDSGNAVRDKARRIKGETIPTP